MNEASRGTRGPWSSRFCNPLPSKRLDLFFVKLAAARRQENLCRWAGGLSTGSSIGASASCKQDPVVLVTQDFR